MSGFSINGVFPEFTGETPYQPEDFADQYPNDVEKQIKAAERKNLAIKEAAEEKRKSGSFKGLFKKREG